MYDASIQNILVINGLLDTATPSSLIMKQLLKYWLVRWIVSKPSFEGNIHELRFGVET
jgi:hypothetical protein